MTLKLRLYSRSGCHLCEDALQALLALKCAKALAVEVVDIDADPELQRLYALRIPVLAVAENNHILCEEGLDSSALLKYVNSHSLA